MERAVRTEQEVAADTIMALVKAKLLRPGSPAQVMSDVSIATKVPMDALRAAAQRWDRNGVVRKPLPDRAAEAAAKIDRPALLVDPPPAETVTPAGESPVQSPEPAVRQPSETAPSVIDPAVGVALLGAQLRGAADLDGYFPDPGPAPARTENPVPGSPDHGGRSRPRRPRRDKGVERQLCLSCHATKAITRFRIANVETGRRSRTCIPCEDDRSNRSVAIAACGTTGLSATFMHHEFDEHEARCTQCRRQLLPGDLIELVGVAAHAEDCPAAQRTG